MRDLSRRDFGLGLGLACLVAGRPGSAAAADKLDQLRKSGVVRLGVANQPPYSMVTPEGVATGIAPEVVRAVMAKLGVPKVEAVVAPYGLLIPGLQAGRWDMIGAAMTITKARCSQVLYTDPVTFDGGIMAYVAGDIPTKPESLSSLIKLGYSVGVLTGSYTIKKLLDVGVPRSAISQFEDNPALIDGLLAKRVQVAFSTFGAIRALKKTRGGFETVYPLTEDPPRGSAPAFSLADAELHAAFQKELRALKASGEFLKISTAFGFEVPPGMLNLTAQQACDIST